MPDFTITNHGTVHTIVANTDNGREWLAEHVDAPGWSQWGDGIAVDPRASWDIYQGILADGLTAE